jgi:hypothetical protein
MTRPFFGPPGLLMAEADIRDKFWPAIRLVVNNLVWILPLIAIEQMVAGELRNAAVIGIIFVVDLMVSVKWGHLDTVVKKAGRKNGIHLALLVGIVGSWAFITVGLGAAGWMIWTHQGFAATRQSAPADEGPIQWNSFFSIEGNLASKVFSLRFPGANISKTRALQLKEANIVSAIDGTLLPLDVVAVDAAGDTKIVPIGQIQLIPPGARIELVAKFGPPDNNVAGNVLGLDPKAFLEKWRQFSFNVTDDVRTYRYDYNDSHMMVFFQGKVGPRVMIKP